jgi:hypothetical protein
MGRRAAAHPPTPMMLLTHICLSAAASLAAPRPHLFLNVVDDLGHNDVPWSPATDVPAPKIKLLAETGIQLTNYYVFRFCSPSRSTFMYVSIRVARIAPS